MHYRKESNTFSLITLCFSAKNVKNAAKQLIQTIKQKEQRNMNKKVANQEKNNQNRVDHNKRDKELERQLNDLTTTLYNLLHHLIILQFAQNRFQNLMISQLKTLFRYQNYLSTISL